MVIREITEKDLRGLLELYLQLHDNIMPEMDDNLLMLWKQILEDKNHHIIVGTEEGKIISSCVLVIILNLTHEQRPYALIENVITAEQHRNKGYATQLLDYAKELAVNENCYKIMLMTGSKKESTLSFYEKAGYNRTDKTAFIQWLE
jgi:GNAT superfamily N-acetyltransferase